MIHLLYIWHVLYQFTIMFPCRTFISYQYNSYSGLLTHVLRVFIIVSFSSPFDDSFSVFLNLSLLTVLPMSNSFLFGTEVDWFDINTLIHSFWFSQGDSGHILHTYSLRSSFLTRLMLTLWLAAPSCCVHSSTLGFLSHFTASCWYLSQPCIRVCSGYSNTSGQLPVQFLYRT